MATALRELPDGCACEDAAALAGMVDGDSPGSDLPGGTSMADSIVEMRLVGD